MAKQTAPYGTWASAITPELMVASNIGLSQPFVFDGALYWMESRPQEQGRSVIVKRMLQQDTTSEVLPAEYNCRTRVHEYGGASYLPTAAGVFFVNFNDQQVYLCDHDTGVRKITSHSELRFADFAYSAQQQMLVAVAERHHADLSEPENQLVAVDINSGQVHTLHQGEDFYASASFSPDGSHLCWLSWNHPNMPWDGTTLWVASVAEGLAIETPEKVAGGDQESVFQPQWSPQSELYYVSDRSNWWNIYAANGHRNVCAMDAEFGMPQWIFGMRRYAFVNDATIVSSYTQAGEESLVTIDVHSGQITNLPRQHSSYESVYAAEGSVCYIAQSPHSFPSLYVEDIGSLATTGTQIISASTLSLNTADVSTGQAISYESAGGAKAHGFYYPPCNAQWAGPADELPPLIVMIHGGPTSATHNDLSLKIQFWTNRGFAVFDSNYRGSTGFGRQYRDALKGQWGVADVEDCDYAVRYLAGQNLIDKQRVAIRGGSAGGFTTLAALAMTDAFKAGASLYGVTDLTALAEDTHKFESRYLDTLVGPYPQQEALYQERSPISHADSINCPVIFLQGLDDKVVPPSQAEMMIDVLVKKGLQVAYVPFEGEGHGFRQSKNIIKALSAELWFYAQVFGFTSDPVEGVEFIT